MSDLDGSALTEALHRLGELLQAPIEIYVIGGSSGLLSGELEGSRTTGDCDVVQWRPEEAWEQVENGASKVAEELGLPETWLNNDCRIFRNQLALGWRDRCEAVTFGTVRVYLLSRRDLIAAKAATGRPQDFSDLVALKPTPEEIAFAHAHLDRLGKEDLDGDAYDSNRTILDSLG